MHARAPPCTPAPYLGARNRLEVVVPLVMLGRGVNGAPDGDDGYRWYRWAGALAARTDLTPAARLVAWALAERADNKTGAVWRGASRAVLGAAAGVKPDTVTRALKELRDLDVLVITLAGGGTTPTRYRLIPHPSIAQTSLGPQSEGAEGPSLGSESEAPSDIDAEPLGPASYQSAVLFSESSLVPTGLSAGERASDEEKPKPSTKRSKRKPVDPEVLPDGLADNLVRLAPRVVAALRDVAAAMEKPKPVTVAAVGRLLSDFPDYDHDHHVGEFRTYWLDGRGKGKQRPDVIATYRKRLRDWCDPGPARRRPASSGGGSFGARAAAEKDAIAAKYAHYDELVNHA